MTTTTTAPTLNDPREGNNGISAEFEWNQGEHLPDLLSGKIVTQLLIQTMRIA